MSAVGEQEIRTQHQVRGLFEGSLGYRYLGHWQDRLDNQNVEEGELRGWLRRQGHDEAIITRALHQLDKARAIGGGQGLYDANREVYGLLRYGVKVKPDVGEQTVTVWLVDWDYPANNDFAIAEEVTVSGEHTKRPDIVLYLNGIAVGVLELKRSTVSVTEGIRQNLTNQKPEFIRDFFATVQLVMAGNPTEGLRYGVIDTPERYWQEWREDSPIEDPLERGLTQLCHPDRLLEILHDFIVFDAGTKKTCRHNQFFGVRAAQEHIRRREGGIIWHTQGSGKSLTMVWLAKWIRENVTNARVLIITDRTELDEQIEKVFKGVDEDIYRTKSGQDLVNVLNDSQEWLIASLVHKFGASEEGDVKAFIDDLQGHLPAGFHAKGELFVFVDECHRTQSGKLHEAMRTVLGPGATLIGFTGTPLLKKDKRKSVEVFGPYIHTYKFDEAVNDGVVLDLRYEARDIDQHITAPERVDQWFELKTKGLNDYAKAQLRKRWGTLQKVLSSKDRLERIYSDILWDMATRDRLMSGHGNAMLVAESIYAACRFFELFQQSELRGKCAVVTSYEPAAATIKGEETGEGETEKAHQYEIYRQMLAEHFDEPADRAITKVETFEKEVKKRFIEEPGRMKLLIVVDKLLTGFDAPPATYLYIDKKMQDHGLFQAICRVNRLHGEDKEYGYIVDYQDLFKSLEQSIQDYTGEAFEGYDKEDVEGLLKDRLGQARQRLEETREQVKALCEPAGPSFDSDAYRLYFVGPSDDPEAQRGNETKRLTLYKLVASFVRAYANLANEMEAAGYSGAEAETIRSEVRHYEQVREEVKLASGDYIDMKVYEPAMRHLLDNYIRAEESETLSRLNELTLVDLVVQKGAEAVNELPESVQGSQDTVAETIENNVRRLITDEMAVNPKYYERMSRLLDELIQQRRQEALEYQEYLKRIAELAKEVAQPGVDDDEYPVTINSPARRALYDNLKDVEGLANMLAPQADRVAEGSSDIAEKATQDIDQAIRQSKPAGWRGNRIKRKQVRNAIKSVIGESPLVDEILEIASHQNDY
mgnify:CR=1 FL=1